jgi:alginate O-acetyltransferase complex protein AlgJ
MTAVSRFYKLLTIYVMVVLILIGMLNLFWNADGLDIENRRHHEFPKLKWSHIDQYSHDFDLYYNDNVFKRNDIILTTNEFKYEVLNINTNDKDISFGQDDWLFAKEYLYHDDIDLVSLETELTKRNDWCNERGIALATAIVPTKGKVYDSYLNSKWKDYVINDTLLQYHINQIISRNKFIDIIDLKPVLDDFGGDTFYRQDSHWNSYGAFLGANYIFKTLDLDQIKPEQVDLNLVESNQNLRDLLGLPIDQGLTSVKVTPKQENLELDYWVRYFSISQHPNKVTTISGNIKNGKKIMIVCDSFGRDLVPFLVLNFEEVVVVHDAWRYLLNQKLIKEHQPDYLLYLIYEKRLNNLIENSNPN